MKLVASILLRPSIIHGRSIVNAARNWSTKVSNPCYNKHGDSGVTDTRLQDQIPKDSSVLDAVGATDELSSFIGLAREFALDKNHAYTDKLYRIQCILVDINTAIIKSPGLDKRHALSARHTHELDEWMNEYIKELPPVEYFIIPGGGKACAALHVARSICRRAERCVVHLVRNKTLDKEAQIYLNRLSDFLFTVSRIAAQLDKKDESIYIPRPESEAKES